MYIGIDVGTSSAKVILFSEKGVPLVKETRAYPIHGNGECLELNPLEVKEAVFSALASVGHVGMPVRSIGISSLGEAAVLLDASGNILGNAILPGDKRGMEEAKVLEKDCSLISRTGLPINATYTVCKLLWIQKKQPELFAKVKAVMLFGDYIAYCLTGQRGIGRSLASRSLAYDLKKDSFFSVASGIDPEWFSTPMDADQCVGEILPEIAGKLQLRVGIPVYAGGHDQPCAMMGVGALKKGEASDSIGTSECITVNLGSEMLEKSWINETNFACEPFLKEGHYDTMAYTHTAGRLVDWYVKKILQRNDEDVYKEMNAACSATPSGLLLLPHFSGSGTPHMDPTSTGAMIGMNLHTDKVTIYQAILESACFEMKENLLLLKEKGIECNRVAAVGGGAKSDRWLQYKADIYQVPVYVPSCFDASALGAAMSGAVGIGDFKNWEQAVSQMITYQKVFYPVEEQMEQYEEEFAKYERIYKAVKSIYQESEE